MATKKTKTNRAAKEVIEHAMETASRGRGRPSDYTQAKADRICQLIAEGDSLTDICRTAGMPSVPTVYRWLDQHPDFHKAYMRARDTQADVYAHEIADIADEVNGCDNMAVVAAARLRIDTRKWIASKLKPKMYGERVETDNVHRITDEQRTSLRDQIIQADTPNEARGALPQPD